jgi:hypothetical protein
MWVWDVALPQPGFPEIKDGLDVSINKKPFPPSIEADVLDAGICEIRRQARAGGLGRAVDHVPKSDSEP